MTLKLIRTHRFTDATIGELYLNETFICYTLENNLKIFPNGKYKLMCEYSPAFKMKLWEFKDIPNRSEIKFHTANYAHQLQGCLAVGDSFTVHYKRSTNYSDFNETMICFSKNALIKLHEFLKQFELQTISCEVIER